MYNLTVEDVSKVNRVYFKDKVKAISSLFNVTFTKDKAFITYSEPYSMDEEALTVKGKALACLKVFIGEFRLYQFNRENK